MPQCHGMALPLPIMLGVLLGSALTSSLGALPNVMGKGLTI